jgi:hypothetical protein
MISRQVVLIVCAALYVAMSYANQGLLFNVATHGTQLNVSNNTNHGAPQVGIKINTPGYHISTPNTYCTHASNNYCMFSLEPNATHSLFIDGPEGNMDIDICLNGPHTISCQHYNNLPIPLMPRYLYVANPNGTSSPASLCTLKRSTGAIVSCQDTTGGVGNNYVGITLNTTGTMAYFTAGNGQTDLYQCPVNADGTFTSCSTTTISTPNGYTAYYGTIALNPTNTIAYFSGQISLYPASLACPINNNGAINTNCSNTGSISSNNYHIGIALNRAGEVVYMTNAYSASGMTICDVNGSTFSNCVIKLGNGSDITFSSNVLGVALNKTENIVYIVDNGNNAVYGCSTALNNTPYFSSCFTAIAGGNLSFLGMIALNKANTVAYISQNNGTTTYVCPIKTNGTFDTCTAEDSFANTYGVALKY